MDLQEMMKNNQQLALEMAKQKHEIEMEILKQNLRRVTEEANNAEYIAGRNKLDLELAQINLDLFKEQIAEAKKADAKRNPNIQ